MSRTITGFVDLGDGVYIDSGSIYNVINIDANGTVNCSSLNADTGTINSNLNVSNITVSNYLNGNIATFSGNIICSNLTANNSIFCSNLSCSNLSCSSNITCSNLTASNNLIVSTLNSTNENISGSLTVSGNIYHNFLSSTPNRKGTTTVANITTIGTQEINTTILDGNYTGNTASFNFYASSNQSVGQPWKAFGTNTGEWSSIGGYSASTGLPTTTVSFQDVQNTTYTGHWVQVQLLGATFQPATITMTLLKVSGGAASKLVSVLGYTSTNAWYLLGTYTNPTNATSTTTLTMSGSDFSQEYSRFVFSVNSTYTIDGIVSPNACLDAISMTGYYRSPTQSIYVPQSMEIGRPDVINSSMTTYSLQVNGDAYFSRSIFMKTFAFEVEGTGSTTNVPANATITEYMTLTTRKNDFGMFSRNWDGAKAIRSGMYHFSFHCRFDDGNYLCAVVPRILNVRDLGVIWVPSDIDPYRRICTYSTTIYLSAGQVFNLRTGYSQNCQFWYFNGFYVGDCY